MHVVLRGVFWGGRNPRGTSAVLHAWGGGGGGRCQPVGRGSLPGDPPWKLFLGADPSGATSAGQECPGFPLPVGAPGSPGGVRKGGAQEPRGCTQGTLGVQAGCGRGVGPSPRSGLQAEPPRGPAGRRAPCVVSPPGFVVSRPVPGQAGGAVPRGETDDRGPPLPHRTSGNVVRAAPLRKFFTLHVSLTAGARIPWERGTGGRAAPGPGGEDGHTGPQLLGETRGPPGGVEGLHPPSPPPLQAGLLCRGDPGGGDVGQRGPPD